MCHFSDTHPIFLTIASGLVLRTRFLYTDGMTTALYPMLFKPIYRDYVWGGGRIAQHFGREDAPARCAESWEISAHADGNGVVENGTLSGRDLSSLCKEYGRQLIGTAADADEFPLLIKLIDARERLSVQVHPNDKTAKQHGGEAKTEMWHILDAEPNAELFAGLRAEVGPRAFQDALKAHKVPSLLSSVRSVAGKSLYVPGGLLHAIGEGNLLIEIQQNSNTTYRVYDWDRLGVDGKPRELHIQQALEVIDWRAPEASLLSPIPMSDATPANQCDRLLRSDFFELRRYKLAEPQVMAMDGLSFHALFASEGSAIIKVDGADDVELPFGRSCLVPASVGEYEIHPVGQGGARGATVLVTTL
jgi:mannose-6-phosphate isomerase